MKPLKSRIEAALVAYLKKSPKIRRIPKVILTSMGTAVDEFPQILVHCEMCSMAPESVPCERMFTASIVISYAVEGKNTKGATFEKNSAEIEKYILDIDALKTQCSDLVIQDLLQYDTDVAVDGTVFGFGVAMTLLFEDP